jgi:hypothetical protein
MLLVGAVQVVVLLLAALVAVAVAEPQRFTHSKPLIYHQQFLLL